MSEPLDIFCIIHGKWRSEHVCLYCCLCFKSITPDECHELPSGQKEDVCISCAEQEQAAMDASKTQAQRV